MTVRRVIICMAAVVAISIVSIYHHASSVKYGYEMGRIRTQDTALRASIASLEGRVAMLASHHNLRAQNERMQLALVNPGDWREGARAIAWAELPQAADMSAPVPQN